MVLGRTEPGKILQQGGEKKRDNLVDSYQILSCLLGLPSFLLMEISELVRLGPNVIVSKMLYEKCGIASGIEGSLCPRGTSKATLGGQTQLFELLHWSMYKCKPVIQQMLSGDGDTEKWSDLSCTAQRFSGRVKMNQIIKKGINVWTDYKLTGREEKREFLNF